MSEPGRAVFVSYASQDAEAARRICEALRAADVEVWFDQNELVGGDAWDAKIRRQIATCALFVPVISAETQARREGYFRLEWKLADERTHLMAEGTPFVLPVVIDDTRDRDALVPKSFLAVQWTRIGSADSLNAFGERVRKLLSDSELEAGRSRPALRGEGVASPVGRTTGSRIGKLAAVAVLMVVVAVVIFATRKSPPPAEPAKSAAAKPPMDLASAKSIAVLPFENLSAEPDSAFFAEGIHGEVLTAVGKISALTVIGRTSVLPYADVKKRNLRQIGVDLGVRTVVEGRVSRAGNQVRITVELVDTQTGRQLWSNRFEREQTDVFAIQAAIAQEVAATLKASLTANERTLIERRPTQNPVAYELYLRAKVQEERLTARSSLEEFERVVAEYQRVVAEDSSFALVYAKLTLLQARIYWFGYMDPTPARRALAEAAMRMALRIAPDAPETHLALGAFDYFCENDWTRALENYRRAEIGLPNDAALQGIMGYAYRRLGNWQQTVRHLERAITLDPRNLFDGAELANFLIHMRRFDVARQQAERFGARFPADSFVAELLVRADFALRGDRAAFLNGLASLPRAERDPHGLRADYERSMWAQDFDRAERTLADARLVGITDKPNIINVPTALHRALVAFLLGKSADAQRFSAQAMEEFERRNWTPRQRPYVMLGMAEAKAFSGRADEAVRDAQAAVTLALKLDAYGGAHALMEAGRMYAAIGRREEALATLRELSKGVSRLSPNEIRLDPLWSRLKDDPRFEEILQAAKP